MIKEEIYKDNVGFHRWKEEFFQQSHTSQSEKEVKANQKFFNVTQKM